jgi:hypothetical protein
MLHPHILINHHLYFTVSVTGMFIVYLLHVDLQQVQSEGWG